MKIVLIGAGSYVFAPTVLLDAIVKGPQSVPGELALVDLNLAAAEAMAGVGRRMAAEVGADWRLSVTADRRAALPGADFVILSAAPEGARRWWLDHDILQAAGLPDQIRECGGLGGLSYALRTISLALDVCTDMAELCPAAVLLDVTNPMPRIITAVSRFTPIRAYGFCNVAQGGAHGYEWLGRLVGRRHEELEVVTAGLNHFAWLISIHDRATGENLHPVVEAAIRSGDGRDFPRLRKWLAEYGGIGVSGGGHMAEYLPPDPAARYSTRPPFHGDAAEREERLRALRAIAAGELDWRTHLTGGSWEHPAEVALALATNTPLRVPIINLPNAGYLTDLPDGRIVEVPALAERGTVRGVEVGRLPGCLGELCRRVSDVHELVAEGAARGDRAALREAIRVDPAIADKQAALSVLDELIAAHRDVLPRFH
jgi:alpha-galactosidase